MRQPVLVALHTSALRHHRQHDDEGRLRPEVQTDAGQGALRCDAPGYGEGQVCPSQVNIEAGKEPVAIAGILHDHIVGVDKVTSGAADQQQPGGVVDRDVRVPGQQGG